MFKIPAILFGVGAVQAFSAIPCTPAGPNPHPTCANSESQSPRDLFRDAEGNLPEGTRHADSPVLNKAQAAYLPQTNIHFHLGAEHRSNSYNDSSDSDEYDSQSDAHRRLSESPRPGFMCPTTKFTEEQLKPYEFKYCTGNVQVGKSYEVHYVHSSAGDTEVGLSDGLGAAAGGTRGLLNPMVAVQAQTFVLVNDSGDSLLQDNDLLHGWGHTDHRNALMYTGSTTGSSFDNDQSCSPYTISWHVDLDCHAISAESFDNMCKDMSELYGLVKDLAPHSSRVLVDASLVVPASEVYELA